MPIIRTKHKQEPGYRTFMNTLLHDNRLSFEARGILVYLLSQKDDWTVRVKDLINQSGKRENGKPVSGRDKIQKALKELESAGYASLESCQNEDGTFAGKTWVIYEDPADNRENRSSVKPDVGDTDERENRLTAEPTNGETAHITSTDLLTNTEELTNTSSSSPARKISRTDSGSIDVKSLKPSEPTTAEKNPPVPAAPPTEPPPPPYEPGETPEAYIVRMTDPGPNSIEMDRWKVKHGLTYERIREEIEVFGDKYILHQFPDGPPHNLAEIVQGRHGIFMRLFRSSFLPKIKRNPVTSNHQPHAKSQQPRNSEPSRRKSQRELLADLYPDVAAELYGDLASGVDGRNPEAASHAHWREA